MRSLELLDGYETQTPPTTDTQFTLANNVSAQNVTSLIFDHTTIWGAIIQYFITRSDATPTRVVETGFLHVAYEPQAGAWTKEQIGFCGDAGIAFDINSSTGQVTYTSTNYGGASYSGKLRYEILKYFGPMT